MLVNMPDQKREFFTFKRMSFKKLLEIAYAILIFPFGALAGEKCKVSKKIEIRGFDLKGVEITEVRD